MAEEPRNTQPVDDKVWLGNWLKSIDESLRKIATYLGWILVIIVLSILASCAVTVFSVGR